MKDLRLELPIRVKKMEGKRKKKFNEMKARSAKIREIMELQEVSRSEARAILLHREIMANVKDFGDE